MHPRPISRHHNLATTTCHCLAANVNGRPILLDVHAPGASVPGPRRLFRNVELRVAAGELVADRGVVNGFLSIRPVEKIELGLDVNNLFDKLGFRGGRLFPILSSTQAVFNNTALYGRTVTGSIRYRF